MTDAAGVGVLTTDRNLRVRSWNPWLAASTGQQEEQVLGRSLEELTGGPTSVWYHDLFVEVLDTATPRVLAPAFHRFLIPCPPREPSPHFDRMQQRVTVAPLRHEEEIVGLIITVEDVTWRLDAERELAAELQRGPQMAAAVTSVGAADWKVRRAAVEALRRAASKDDVEHLIQTLRRDHQDIDLLSSALQVLVSADIDVGPALIELLSDGDPNLRMHAALALGQLRSHTAASPLIAALQDADANVRFHAIEALGLLGAPEAVDPLAEIAASGDFFLAFAAIEALGKTDDARVAPRLTAMLADETLRPAIVETLANLGDEDCVAPLVGRLNAGAADADAAAIAAALERIHARYQEAYDAGLHIADIVRRHINPDGVRTLSEALERRTVPLRPLIAVLGWAGPSALPALISVLGDEAVRASVDTALFAIGSEAVDPLLQRLETGTREERLAAAALLGRYGDRRAVLPLIPLLGTADAELAATAAGALAVLGDPAALTDLLPLFEHPRATVRQAAISAINAISADATAARIRERLTDGNPRVRECAIRVAGYFGFADSVAAILAGAEDGHEDVRRAAIEQLAVLQDPRAHRVLVAALSSDTARNRAAAAHVAGFADDSSTEQALIGALSDADPWVRYFAAGSIGRREVTMAASALVQHALHDPATQVRIAALHALAASNAPQLSAVATTLMRETDPDLVAAALTALAPVEDPHVDEHLADAARSPDLARRVPAIQALGSRPGHRSVEVLAWAARVGEPRELSGVAIDGLRRLAQAPAQDARTAAVEALLALGAERGTRDAALAVLSTLPDSIADSTVAAMATSLAAGRLNVRLAAVEALARLRHRSASDALAHALQDPVAAVRAAAVGAFGRLGTAGAAPLIASMQEQDPDEGVRRRAAGVCARHGWSKRGAR